MVRFAVRWWAPFVVPMAMILAIAALGSARDHTWGSPGFAFGVVLALTVLCAAFALIVLTLGVVRRLPEVALLGAVLWVASLLGVTHALLLPGGVSAANPGSTVAIMAAVPCALAAALPVLLDQTPLGRRLAGRWRAWVALWLVGPVVVSVGLVLSPGLVHAPRAGGFVAVAVIATSLLGTGALSLRHLRLYAIGRRGGSLMVSLGFIAPGLATIAFLGAGALSPGWWLAHLVDGLGVLFAAGGLLIAHWRDRSLAIVLSPVLTREPLAALELGLTPVVHDFIAALEAKDEVTREHVVRVSELAMRAGERADMGPLALRAVGLGGLLHDVGKLLTPQAILTKPGGLTGPERAVIERHTLDGEAMISPYPHLAMVAGVVRSHHERPDGRGYPDGLTAREIPAAAAIVSVVDAWDAMVSDRPYREGMPRDRAAAILREGAGSQWSNRAVDTVLAELDEHGPVAAPALQRVGRSHTQGTRADAEDLLAACLPEPGSLSAAT